MQYIVELIELWWACLTTAMKSRSLDFPLSLILGLMLGLLFCWLLGQSVKLWNRRYQLSLTLKLLCGLTVPLTIIFTLTFTSSKNLEEAIRLRLLTWKEKALADQDWQRDCFNQAWDAVAKLGHEPSVRLSPSPRTDPSIHIIAMSHAESKSAVARTYASVALRRFEADHSYIASILNSSTEVPKERIDVSMLSWFKDHPGEAYPLEQGMNLAIGMLLDEAKPQIAPVVSYTQRLSFAFFLLCQIIPFFILSFFAHRANCPATVASAPSF